MMAGSTLLPVAMVVMMGVMMGGMVAGAGWTILRRAGNRTTETPSASSVKPSGSTLLKVAANCLFQ
jgi:hypothetical protein